MSRRPTTATARHVQVELLRLHVNDLDALLRRMKRRELNADEAKRFGHAVAILRTAHIAIRKGATP